MGFIITHEGVEKEVKFGIKTVRALDKHFEKDFKEAAGGFGAGVTAAYLGLLAGDIDVLQKLLTFTTGLNINQSDDYIDNHEDIDELFESFLEQLKNSAASRRQVAYLQKNMEKAEKDAAEKEKAAMKATQ